jgi:GNAT superfamily N-acetyltransferase
MDAAPRPELIARAQAAYAAMFVAVASCAPDARIERRDGLLLVGPAAVLPRYNAAFAYETPADPRATIAAGVAFFAALGSRWMLKASGAAADALDAAARTAGMVHEQEPGMLLTALGDAAAPASLAIAPVEDVASLWTFDQTMQAGFESTLPIAEPAVMDAGTLVRVPELRFFLGHCDGAPVATATLFARDGVACIADISVVPAYRRRGFGAAITAHALTEGRKQGCAIAYLEASELGAPVYRRLGFRDAVVCHGWLSPPV